MMQITHFPACYSALMPQMLCRYVISIKTDLRCSISRGHGALGDQPR